RMIIAGLEYEKDIPFSKVYFTGIVRDKQGRKMSKSLGNSPDLLDLIDKYGADAVRFGIMISSPAGNDLLFDESSLQHASNFNNKIWNALKLVKAVWQIDGSPDDRLVESSRTEKWRPKSEKSSLAINWFYNKLNHSKAEIDKQYEEFKLSEILKNIYSLIWDD